MKKFLTVSLALFAGVMFLGCASTPRIDDELLISRNPNNPFQGTFLQMGDTGPAHLGGRPQYLIVINDNMVTTYLFSPGVYGIGRGWNMVSTTPFERMRTQLWLSDDGNILTVDRGLSYRRIE